VVCPQYQARPSFQRDSRTFEPWHTLDVRVCLASADCMKGQPLRRVAQPSCFLTWQRRHAFARQDALKRPVGVDLRGAKDKANRELRIDDCQSLGRQP